MRRKWQRTVLLERAPDPARELPTAGLARLEQIIGDRTVSPPIEPVIPVSKSTWWEGVRSGRFPPAVRVNKGVSAWRWEDIHRLRESLRPDDDWVPPGPRRTLNTTTTRARAMRISPNSSESVRVDPTQRNFGSLPLSPRNAHKGD